VIYDTRPSRLSEQVHLRNLSAFIYLLCDERKGISTIKHEVNRYDDKKEVTEKYIEKTLNDLVQKKLMIPDNGQYLSLANDLQLMADNESSTLAYLLVSNQQD
jgi:hypothetical protein